MLRFKQNDAAVAIILTLSELVTIPEPNYLFVFTHVLTRDVVSFAKLNTDDQSDYPDRYNEFTIDPATLFAGKQPGEWHYQVFDQEYAENTDPAQTNGLIESGKMILDRSTDFAYTPYDSTASFKTYNG